MRRRTLALPILIPVLALGLTACGSGGAAGGGATPQSKKADDITAMRDFAKCMRDNGANMPDPVQDEGGIRTEIKSEKGDEQKVRAAEEKCRHLRPDGGEPPKLNAQQLDQARNHAKCMREHGIEMPDPDENGRVTIRRTAKPGSGGDMRVGGDPDSQKFKDADKACRHLRPKLGTGEEKGG